MMNRKGIVSIALSLAMTGCAVTLENEKLNNSNKKEQTQGNGDEKIDTNLLNQASEIVKVLSSDNYEGRKPGTKGMEKACTFVENYYRQIGVSPYFKDGYRDKVTVNNRTSCNIVGKITASTETDDWILIGAHLDHLGKIKSSQDSVYNGANDNATGVSAVLTIAKNLKSEQLSKNIIFAIFTEEESGLHGAKHLAKRLKTEGIHLQYVINFEMLGKPLTNAPSQIYITGFDKSNFAEATNKALNTEFIKFERISKTYGLFSQADNYPFYQEFLIPSHTLSTYNFKNFDYYHDLRDEFNEIDTLHLNKTIDKCSEMVYQLVKQNVEINLK